MTPVGPAAAAAARTSQPARAVRKTGRVLGNMAVCSCEKKGEVRPRPVVRRIASSKVTAPATEIAPAKVTAPEVPSAEVAAPEIAAVAKVAAAARVPSAAV